MKALAPLVVCAAAAAAEVTLVSAGSSSWGDETAEPTSGASGSGYDQPPMSSSPPTTESPMPTPESPWSTTAAAPWPTPAEPWKSTTGPSPWPTTWYPTWAPTPTSVPWPSGDWNWDSSRADGSSSTSSGSSDGDEAGVEIFYPDMDGSIETTRRRTFYFDKSQGFDVCATNASDDGLKNRSCSPYCIRLVFESDFGAMSPFDAFVMDRYESPRGPVVLEKSHWEHRALPLILGSMTNETIARLGANWSEVFNWNDTRRTTWLLSPPDGATELDMTLSLKQLYTLLPGYTGTNASSDGPFYSADPTDQLIVRVVGQLTSPLAGASAMMPIVVNHTGSRLVDVNLTSTRLNPGENMYDGDEIQLTFTLSRRKYGGIMPWFPAKPSSECDVCANQNAIPEPFQQCLESQLQGQNAVFEDLLTSLNDRWSLDMEPFAEFCFGAIASGEWVNGTNANTPSSLQFWDGDQWDANTTGDPLETDKRWQILRQTDEALRCWAETQCAMGGAHVKSDGQVVVLHHSQARTVIEFGQPDYDFYLLLGLNHTGQNETETVTTRVFTNETTPEELMEAITSAFPEADKLSLDVSVVISNNLWVVNYYMALNEQLLDQYHSAHQWSSVAASTSGGDDLLRDGRSHSGSDEAGTTASSSIESSSEWGSSTGSDTDADRPQLPKLYEVPPAVFTIEIISHNITIVPQVLAVFTSNDDINLSYRSSNYALRFQVAPLNLNKFEYVPPPSYVDLDWREEPVWMEQVRHMMPVFMANDSCGDCMAQYEACLFDLDCAFGVNNYLADALARHRLLWTTQILRSDTSDSVVYQVNASDAVRNAKPFFPANSSAKFHGLLLCWASRRCNLDEQGTVLNNITNHVEWASPTLFNLTGTQVEILTHTDEVLTFYNGGHAFPFSVHGNESELGFFLNDVVFKHQSAGENLVNVDVFFDQPSWSSTPVRFVVKFANVLAEGIACMPHTSTTMVSVKPWTLMIEVTRPSVVDENGGWPTIQWPRLMNWLQVFRYVPSSSYPGWHNSTNNSNNWPTPNPIYPPPPSPPSAYYGYCANMLEPCARNQSCLQAVHAWLPRVLPSNTTYLYPDWDGVYRLHWKSEQLGDSYQEGVLSFLSCLSTSGYALGYSHDYDKNAYLPTTIQLRASRTVYVAPQSEFTLIYESLGESGNISQGTNMSDYLYMIQHYFGHTIQVSSWWDWSRSQITYKFTGAISALNMLSINSDPSTYITPVTWSAWFESYSPAGPVWDYLVDWYTPGFTTGGVATCEMCLSKLQDCYDDKECWRGVQETIVPLLRQPDGALYSSQWFDSNGVVYKTDLGNVLRNRVLSMPATLRTTFSTPESWQRWTEILSCFSANRCDVESMGSAQEPPATAHVPSYLTTQPAHSELLLHVNSTVTMNVHGGHYTYTETASGSPHELSVFFQFAGIPLHVELTGVNPFSYNITFSDLYFGEMPELYLSANGEMSASDSYPYVHITPWAILIESRGQIPEWDQLTTMLSSPPQLFLSGGSGSGASSYSLHCDSADALRHVCYSSYECQSLLTVALYQLRDRLATVPATYNPTTKLFEMDLTWWLTSQVFPFATTEIVRMLLDVLRESARCASSSTSTWMAATPMFLDMELSFMRPPNGTVYLEYLNSTFTYEDEALGDDRIYGFAQFVIDHVVTPSGPSAGVSNWFAGMDEGVIRHNFEFLKVYGLPPPHLYGVNPETGHWVESTATSWRLLFRSPTYTLDNAFAPWLEWLGTNPVW